MRKEKILFEVIVTNQCNKRCDYCKLDFRDSFISNKIVNDFINFIKNESINLESIIINFFWWEPLLKKDIIINIINSLKEVKNIQFMIWTNWLLLDNDFLDFSKENNIHYYLSIDTDNWETILEKEILKNYINNIEINFILNPNSLDNVYFLYEKILSFWYKKINIMPVFATIKWSQNKLIDLNKFIKYVNNNSSGIIINKYKYFNWVSSDKQFILETNWNVYGDLDSLLWIQKQNKNLTKKLIKEIETKTFLWKIDNNNLSQILHKYSIGNILKLVFKIPKEQGFIVLYKLIKIILEKK